MRVVVLLASGVLAGLLGAAASCGSSDDAATPAADASPPDTGPDDTDADPRPPTPPEWDRSVTRPDEGAAAADRAACKFARGALADETLGTSIPVGKDIAIETIVVLVQENRSFDHYFSRFGAYAGRSDVEVAGDEAGVPETGDGGALHPRHRGDRFCFKDTNHTWEGAHLEWNGGKNDGFWQANDLGPDAGGGDRALWWYDEQELPYYYALAKEFGLGDHYFSSVLGPTSPNRAYISAATSLGQTTNVVPDTSAYEYPANDLVIFDELDKRHVDFTLYTAQGIDSALYLLLGDTVKNRWSKDHVANAKAFDAAAAAGTLPPVTFYDSDYSTEGGSEAEDEHPPGDLQIGQSVMASVIGKLMKSPQWPHMAIFLTYDENGGIYDHVPPPPACAPDDKTPVDGNGFAIPGAFDRLGFRVPFLVISPFAKRGYVSHTVFDHTSLTRFIEARFRVPALTKRDANAAIPTDFFDFAQPPRDPPTLPAAAIDRNAHGDCYKAFPPP